MCKEFKNFILRQKKYEHVNSNEQLNMDEITKKNYDEAFAEAVAHLKNEQSIPEDIIEKAIGKKPTSVIDTPDMDTIMMQIETCNNYDAERKRFIYKVMHTAHPRY